MAKAAAMAAVRHKSQMAKVKKRMAKLRAVRLQYVLGMLGDTDAFVAGLLRFEIDAAMDEYRVQRYRQWQLSHPRARLCGLSEVSSVPRLRVRPLPPSKSVSFAPPL